MLITATFILMLYLHLALVGDSQLSSNTSAASNTTGAATNTTTNTTAVTLSPTAAPTTTITNLSNGTNATVANETLLQEEVIPDGPLIINITEFELSPEQKYSLENYADPNRAIEEYEQTLPNKEIELEQIALREFYHATNGIYWINNWDFTVKNTDVPDIITGDPSDGNKPLINLNNATFYYTLCGEYGITCESDGYVTNISLSGNNLSGIIPPSFMNLTNLIDIDLSMNFLSGDIQFAAKFQTIQSLKLSSNLFTGAIPSALFLYVQGLLIFQIENNRLNGSIPETFGKQRNLRDFRISWNQITGTLPPEMGNQFALEKFMAGHNQITGGFPSSFTDLSNTLEVLILSSNLLTSQISPNISNFHKLKILALDNNKLYGEIPAMSALNRLQVLWLHNNRLWGNIQASMNVTSMSSTPASALALLQTLRLRGNYFDCELYDKQHGFAYAVHTDSPVSKDTCVAKTYSNPDTEAVVNVDKAIP